MKKLFALLLAVTMCFALVACGGETQTNDNATQQSNNEVKKDEKDTASKVVVVRKWACDKDNSTLLINEDNTGEINLGEEVIAITWKYDEATHLMIVTATEKGWDDEVTYFESDDTLYVDSMTYVRAE